jgi:hypothetical protein
MQNKMQTANNNKKSRRAKDLLFRIPFLPLQDFRFMVSIGH